MRIAYYLSPVLEFGHLPLDQCSCRLGWKWFGYVHFFGNSFTRTLAQTRSVPFGYCPLRTSRYLPSETRDDIFSLGIVFWRSRYFSGVLANCQTAGSANLKLCGGSGSNNNRNRIQEHRRRLSHVRRRRPKDRGMEQRRKDNAFIRYLCSVGLSNR